VKCSMISYYSRSFSVKISIFHKIAVIVMFPFFACSSFHNEHGRNINKLANVMFLMHHKTKNLYSFFQL